MLLVKSNNYVISPLLLAPTVTQIKYFQTLIKLLLLLLSFNKNEITQDSRRRNTFKTLFGKDSIASKLMPKH